MQRKGGSIGNERRKATVDTIGHEDLPVW